MFKRSYLDMLSYHVIIILSRSWSSYRCVLQIYMCVSAGHRRKRCITVYVKKKDAS